VKPTKANLTKARRFLLRKWQERAVERGLEKPETLHDACKFASLFAQWVFGGELRGNYDHQFVQLGKQIIDLAEAQGERPYRHDPKFWLNRQHRESLDSCRPRVARWVAEFLDANS